MEMLSAAVTPDPEPGQVCEVHEVRAFDATARSASKARHWLRKLLRLNGLQEEQVHSLELLASELIANCVMHTPASVIVVRVSLVDDSVSVSVRDPGSGGRTSTRTLDPDIGGRGLAIVASVSSSWGIRSVAGGKEIWFRLDVPRPVESSTGMVGPLGPRTDQRLAEQFLGSVS
jgi:serine/threonine-protein kinase RsbW